MNLPTLLVLGLLSTACPAAEAPAEKGALLFSDDFERAEAGPAWDASRKLFSIVAGALKGGQVLTEHGAVAGVNVVFKDAVIEFRFRFEGAASINAVCDDRNFKDSHAGHICRTTLAPKLIRLGDDREGGMRNDILEMHKDPARKAEWEKLMEGRTKTFPTKLEPHRWYRLTMEIQGEEMRVSLDGILIGQLKSPGIGHPTKTRFHFTITGQDALIDDVQIRALPQSRTR